MNTGTSASSFSILWDFLSNFPHFPLHWNQFSRHTFLSPQVWPLHRRVFRQQKKQTKSRQRPLQWPLSDLFFQLSVFLWGPSGPLSKGVQKCFNCLRLALNHNQLALRISWSKVKFWRQRETLLIIIKEGLTLSNHITLWNTFSLKEWQDV